MSKEKLMKAKINRFSNIKTLIIIIIKIIQFYLILILDSTLNNVPIINNHKIILDLILIRKMFNKNKIILILILISILQTIVITLQIKITLDLILSKISIKINKTHLNKIPLININL